MTWLVRRKTMRRTRAQAHRLAERLRAAGCLDVSVTRVSPTDWAITYTERPR